MSRTYGSEDWSLEEIRDLFYVEVDDTVGLSELRIANHRLAKLHHSATFELAMASERLDLAKESWEEEKDKLVNQMTEVDRDKTSRERLTVDQRTSKVNTVLAALLRNYRRGEQEVSQWNKVMEHLKYSAKRIDSSIIIESVEAKMLKSLGDGSSS